MAFCFTCGETPPILLTCAACGQASYCSKQCQKANWIVHKHTCEPPDLEPIPLPVTSPEPERSACRFFKLDDETTIIEMSFPLETSTPEAEVYWLVDNSSSMGESSIEAVKLIAEKFKGRQATIMTFSNTQKVIAKGISIPNIVPNTDPRSYGYKLTPQQAGDATIAICNGAIEMPAQGSTDIGEGVKAVVDCIVKDSNAGTPVILIVLTDGENTPGFANPIDIIKAQSSRVQGIQLSVMLVAVTSSSSTALSMVIKGLETVDIGLSPIHYCERRDMMGILSNFVIPEVLSARVQTKEFRLSSGGVCVRIDKPLGNMFRCESGDLFIVEGSFDADSIEGVVASKIPDEEGSSIIESAFEELLRQARIVQVAGMATNSAQGATACAARLEKWIKIAETKLKPTFDFAVTAPVRLHLYKQWKSSIVFLQTIRNKVLGLGAKLSGSKDQAAYLNGCDRKFAADAMARSKDTTDEKDLITEVRSMVAVLESAMNDDLRHRAMLLSIDQEFGAIIKSCPDLHSAMKKMFGAESTSYLSTATARDHFLDFKLYGDLDATNVHHVLVTFGVIANPMVMEVCDATQLDPFKWTLHGISYNQFDTASWCLGMSTENKMPPPEGGRSPNGVLVLIDPAWIRTYRVFLRSTIFKKLVSNILCGDLYMYQGIMQVFAIYAKAFAFFCTPVDKAEKFDKDLEGTLRRIYLGKAYMCGDCFKGPVDHMACDYLDTHHGEENDDGHVIDNRCPWCGWFSPNIKDWPKWDGKIPDRPERLQAKMGVGKKEVGLDPLSSAAIMHALRTLLTVRVLMSEEMATKFAETKAYYASELSNPLMLTLVVGAFGGEVDDARLVNEALARSVGDYVKMTRMDVQTFLFGLFDIEGSKPSMDIFGKVEGWCEPVLQSLAFSRRLQTVLKTRGGWYALENDMIRGEHACKCWVDAIKSEPVSTADLLAEIGLCGEVRVAMVAQAMRCFDSSQRHDLPDARDPATLAAIKVDLKKEHTAKYCMELARKRRDAERAEKVARSQQPDGYLLAKQAAYDRANPNVKALLDELAHIDYVLRFHALKAMLHDIGEKNAAGLLEALDLF